jgi:hypothetical protein
MKKPIFALIICFLSMSSMNAQGISKIKITIGTTSFVATTYDNATAKAFIALLPMTVTMNELNGNEKYNYLSGNLPNSPVNPATINNGDLMLYGSNCIVLFYETFSTTYSYTRIASVDSPTNLKTALGSNNPTVTFEVMNGTTAIDNLKQNSIDYKITNDGILQYTGTAKRISLWDINGRILSSTTSQTLNMNNFSRGVYLLRIEEESQNKTRTIKIKY